jgi:hypothetical protein
VGDLGSHNAAHNRAAVEPGSDLEPVPGFVLYFKGDGLKATSRNRFKRLKIAAAKKRCLSEEKRLFRP